MYMQVKCDECESWLHQRCVNIQTQEDHDTEFYNSTKFLGVCCSSDRKFKLQ